MGNKYSKLLHIVISLSLVYPPNLFSTTPLKKFKPQVQILNNSQGDDLDLSKLFPQLTKDKKENGKTKTKSDFDDLLQSIRDKERDVANEKPPGRTQPPGQTASGVPADAGKARGEPAPGDRGGNAKVSIQTGNGATPLPNIQNVDQWIPICFIFKVPEWTDDQIQKVVKLNIDNYGKCGIAMEPHIFKVPAMPKDADQINKLSQQVCPLNQVFKVGGSAAQALTNSDGTADNMCREPAKKGPPPDQSKNLPEWSESVAGCSVLGNGNAKDSKSLTKKEYDMQARGNYGGRGESGKPATSIVDIGQGASVSFHELGHSNGGPGDPKGGGGDYLVNEGESVMMGHKPGIPVGCGLEKLGPPDEEFRKKNGEAGEGGGNKDNCFFEKNQALGCSSLRGGANDNSDHRHVWDKNWQFDKNNMLWDFLAGKSFFEAQPVNRPVTKISGVHGGRPPMPGLPNTTPGVLSQSEPKNDKKTHSKPAKGNKIMPDTLSLRNGDFSRPPRPGSPPSSRPTEVTDTPPSDAPVGSAQGTDPTTRTVRVEEGGGNAAVAGDNSNGVSSVNGNSSVSSSGGSSNSTISADGSIERSSASIDSDNQTENTSINFGETRKRSTDSDDFFDKSNKNSTSDPSVRVRGSGTRR